MEKFTKVKNIGKGNMGACALARNNDDGRYYVIKQVDLAKLNKKERQQSLNEAKLLSSVRHPNVINYVDSFLARKSDHLCIVMEFADGGDLSHKIKNSHGTNFPQDQVLDWFIQITLALHHIHSRKILHRDVKTQNIFLTQEGVCKLGDFGIARTLSNTFDQANTFVGTPYYLSPELILERPYDGMSDVWALGVVLYEMMALKHPFNANDMKSLMHRILKVQYEAPPHVYSNEMRAIVGKLLVKDPAQRMRLSEVLELPIVVHRMQQWLQGGIVPSRYLASLIRHKLLPAAVTASPILGPDGQPLPILPPVQPPPAMAAATRPALMAAGGGGAADNDSRVSRLMQEEYAAKQQRREEIRNEFGDLKGGGGAASRISPTGNNTKAPSPPPAYHYGAGNNAAPMPSRDPALLSHEPSIIRAAGPREVALAQRNLPPLGNGGIGGPMAPSAAPHAAPYGGRSAIVDALSDDRSAGVMPQLRGGGARGPVTGGMQSQATGLSAPNVRIQPSARGLSGVAALPPHLQQPLGIPASNYSNALGGLGGMRSAAPSAAHHGQGPNANIQLMLEKAAQQRMLNRQQAAPRAY